MSTDLDQQLHASVMRREAEKEKQFREERARRDEEFMLGFGATEMGKEELRKVIDSDRRMYYRTEDLNDKLYIHYKGWKDIKGLEGWTGLKALYAECNAFGRISGLETCTKLRSLFLQENCIKKISGLENCPDLWNLNLTSNFIQRLEGLSHLKNLNTLIIAKNQIGVNGLDDVLELVGSPLSSLDIQDNKISDVDVVPEVFMQMPGLRVLYLKGNPCAKKIPNYRKSLTSLCQELRYLDDRPVFEDDRRAAEAFNRGGLEEERTERRKIKDEKNAAHDKNMRAFQEMVERVRLEKRERDSMRLEDKFTDEDDPGMHKERRAKERLEEWKIENAESLKDHDLERAKRILQAEKDAAGENTTPFGDVPPVPELAAQEPAAGAKPKEDNRKLAYEDIWDDVPVGSKGPAKPSAAPPQAAVAAGAQAPPQTAQNGDVGPDARFCPASSFQGSRPGWFFGTGDRGLGYYRDATALGGAMQEVPMAPPAAASTISSDSWYTRYSSKLQRQNVVVEDSIRAAEAAADGGVQNAASLANDGRPAFAPPPRRIPEPAASSLVAESAAASATVDSELQEMD